MGSIIATPRQVADQILWLRRSLSTTPMHILKLTYLCHGWMLGHYGRSLINEPVEAWRYGPVVPSQYRTYKSFGGKSIKIVPVNQTDEFDSDQNGLIQAVLNAYEDYSPWALSAITHQPDTPWYKVYRDGQGVGSIIPNDLIQNYYERQIQNQP